MPADSLGKELKPGDACVQSGLYEVVHQTHRPAHNVIVSAGQIFPPCRRCGDAVRFRLVLTSAVPPGRRARAAKRKN